jgi:hypothetical protein
MKTSSLKLIVLNLALAAGLTGCESGFFGQGTSKSYDKGAATSTALQAAAGATAQTTTGVNGVLAALNNLTFKSQGDLRHQYDALVSASGKLNDSIATLNTKVVAMQSAAATYVSDWTNQLTALQSDVLRQRSAERKDEVIARLGEVNTSYQGMTGMLTPFTTDVKDIETYLGTDLTVDGLDKIKDVVAKTKVDAVPLRDAIKQLQASFSSLATALSPVVPVTGQK